MKTLLIVTLLVFLMVNVAPVLAQEPPDPCAYPRVRSLRIFGITVYLDHIVQVAVGRLACPAAEIP
jgi:hypothetical protein